MSRRIPETDWLPPGATELDLFPPKPTAPILTCRGCGKDVSLYCLFVTDGGVCPECEWGMPKC